MLRAERNSGRRRSQQVIKISANDVHLYIRLTNQPSIHIYIYMMIRARTTIPQR